MAIEPYDEELHRELILALVATGAKQSALAHYEKVKEMFPDMEDIEYKIEFKEEAKYKINMKYRLKIDNIYNSLINNNFKNYLNINKKIKKNNNIFEKISA